MKGLIRIARATLSSSTTEVINSKFNLELGRNQVALIKRLDINVFMTADTHDVRIGVYRKSDADISSTVDVSNFNLVQDRNWLSWRIYDTGGAAYTGKFNFNDEVIFPDKTVVIRAPLLVLQNIQSINASANGAIMYEQIDINEKEMARMMMLYKGK